MTTAVTGATGFLGSAVVTDLITREQPVRILARDEKKARQQFGDAVTIIPGDITDAAQVQRAVAGATTIYHLAGRLYHPSIPAELYRQTHVQGTRVLLRACLGQTQLRRIVYVSTTGVYGITGETPAAEDAPFAPTNPYEATKLEGEQLALQAYREQGLPVTVVRPGLVYGPGDLHLLGFFLSIKKGLFRVIDGGKALLHPVYIDDLIAALLLCAERSQTPGRSYNIAGDRPVSVRELATAIAHALGRELPAGSIPLWLANLASDIFAVMPGINGEHAPLTRSRVKFLTNSRIYDISRARSELDYAPKVGLEAGMKMTATWYYKHHYLDDSSRSGKTV
jgi:nucleoside-diphosphate-sugar epimerase